MLSVGLGTKAIRMEKIFWLWAGITLFSVNIYAQSLDIDILKNINPHRNQSLDASLVFLSDATAPLVIGMPILITGIGLIKKDSAMTRKGLYVGVSVASSLTLTFIMKYAINRPRPYVTYPFLDNQKTESDPSFPSGHTSSSFAFATSLSLAHPKWYIIAPAYTYATLTAYARMHLGVHYPSDVIVGAVVGTGCAWLSHHLNKKIKINWRRR
jgi:membrane-associated phospholipid phosphatase